MSTPGTALLTGGAKRLGREIAMRLARRGYRIALHYNNSQEAAESTAKGVRDHGGKCRLIRADLSSMDQVREIVPRIHADCPDLSLLINNASIFERGGLLETDEDLYDRHMAINLRAPVFLTRDFARAVDTGVVINLIDTKAARNVVNYFAYTMTKKALLDFTKMAAFALGPGIRVNAVAPGLVLPPEDETMDYLARQAESIPLRRHGGPQDICNAVEYLIDNDFLTGQCIFVDGGEHLK